MSRITFLSRLHPFLHRRVRLENDHVAKAFVGYYQLVKSPPANVEELCLESSVNIITAADVLRLCQKIRSLTIRFSYRHIQNYEANPLLEPLEALRSLRSLYIELVTVGGLRVCYLPDYPIFHRLTHLHLEATGIALSTIPFGLSKLSNLTHLSLRWYMSRSCTSGLQGFLARCSSRVLVLWYLGSEYNSFEDDLGRRKLADRRVVLLQHSRYTEYVAGGEFWSYAEQIIASKIRTNGK
ncbi:hypothetical protein EV363DRAFT_1217580 [Boletus edulis]|uniref:Uncharacterized protein n=1 Tax=Boletus edulis BED1 TaxID=1328754 RepID=A0AAD4C5M6_BOLED|nr:hypothetical protein EV363DRAFT_1217580 [Boletus edulis]KAF8449432.1 hypothetical protein L210DRAFT_927169 [Boletus edulis BED1]